MSERNLFASILRSVSLGHALTDMYWVIFPALLPLIQKEFALSYAQAGLLITSFIVTAGLGSFITGYLGDRFGQRIILSGGFLICSLALILCARSNFYWELLLTSLLLGAGASTFHPNSIALLMNLFSERRGRALGIFTFSGFMGVAVMLAVVSYLAGIMLSWRQIIFIFAWPGLIFAPFFFRSLSFSIEKKKEQNKAELKSTHLSKNILFLLIVFFAANLALTISFNGVYFFIPTFVVHAKGVGLEGANYFYILVAVGGMIGSFFSGKLVDRFSPLPVILITTVIAIPIIFLLTLATNFISLALILVFFGVSYASIFPAQGVYLALISTYSLGKTYGLIQCLTILVGAAAPGIIGLLADRLGLVTALQLGTIPLILAGVLFIYLATRTSLQNPSS
jgi:FSR family fosmidomycin resistance protein-like MFS transporter